MEKFILGLIIGALLGIVGMSELDKKAMSDARSKADSAKAYWSNQSQQQISELSSQMNNLLNDDRYRYEKAIGDLAQQYNDRIKHCLVFSSK